MLTDMCDVTHHSCALGLCVHVQRHFILVRVQVWCITHVPVSPTNDMITYPKHYMLATGPH